MSSFPLGRVLPSCASQRARTAERGWPASSSHHHACAGGESVERGRPSRPRREGERRWVREEVRYALPGSGRRYGGERGAASSGSRGSWGRADRRPEPVGGRQGVQGERRAMTLPAVCGGPHAAQAAPGRALGEPPEGRRVLSRHGRRLAIRKVGPYTLSEGPLQARLSRSGVTSTRRFFVALYFPISASPKPKEAERDHAGLPVRPY